MAKKEKILKIKKIKVLDTQDILKRKHPCHHCEGEGCKKCNDTGIQADEARQWSPEFFITKTKKNK